MVQSTSRTTPAASAGTGRRFRSSAGECARSVVSSGSVRLDEVELEGDDDSASLILRRHPPRGASFTACSMAVVLSRYASNIDSRPTTASRSRHANGAGGPKRSLGDRFGEGLIAHVASVDQSANVSAATDRQAREHELALGTPDIGFRCWPVVRGLLRQAPDRRHLDPPPCRTNESDRMPAGLTPSCCGILSSRSRSERTDVSASRREVTTWLRRSCGSIGSWSDASRMSSGWTGPRPMRKPSSSLPASPNGWPTPSMRRWATAQPARTGMSSLAVRLLTGDSWRWPISNPALRPGSDESRRWAEHDAPSSCASSPPTDWLRGRGSPWPKQTGAFRPFPSGSRGRSGRSGLRSLPLTWVEPEGQARRGPGTPRS